MSPARSRCVSISLFPSRYLSLFFYLSCPLSLSLSRSLLARAHTHTHERERCLSFCIYLPLALEIFCYGYEHVFRNVRHLHACDIWYVAVDGAYYFWRDSCSWRGEIETQSLQSRSQVFFLYGTCMLSGVYFMCIYSIFLGPMRTHVLQALRAAFLFLTQDGYFACSACIHKYIACVHAFVHTFVCERFLHILASIFHRLQVCVCWRV